MTSETAAQRLGRLVRERRKQLKMTQADVQEVGGPSTATLRLIEGGHHTDFRDGTGAALEAAIRWQSGSIDNVLAGDDPTPLQPGTASQKPQRQGQTGSQFADPREALEEMLGVVDSSVQAYVEIAALERGGSEEHNAKLDHVQSKLAVTISRSLTMTCELLGEQLADGDVSDEDVLSGAADFAEYLRANKAKLEHLIQATARLATQEPSGVQVGTAQSNGSRQFPTGHFAHKKLLAPDKPPADPPASTDE